MQEVKKKKNKKKLSLSRIILYAATFIFLVYSATTIISQSVQLSEKKQEYENIVQAISIQKDENEKLIKVLSYDDAENEDYIKDKARSDLDYIEEGEQVFVIVSGDWLNNFLILYILRSIILYGTWSRNDFRG